MTCPFPPLFRNRINRINLTRNFRRFEHLCCLDNGITLCTACFPNAFVDCKPKMATNRARRCNRRILSLPSSNPLTNRIHNLLRLPPPFRMCRFLLQRARRIVPALRSNENPWASTAITTALMASCMDTIRVTRRSLTFANTARRNSRPLVTWKCTYAFTPVRSLLVVLTVENALLRRSI